jgi:hypothetical protein
MGRFGEWLASLSVRDSILFTSAQRRRLSVLVRGDQMARELQGLCLRHRFLSERAASRNRALVWIATADEARVRPLGRSIPQLFDIIYPQSGEENLTPYHQFSYLIVNTPECVQWLGRPPDRGWQHWVIPHHHCNVSGYRLSEERLARPAVVGYVGETAHLHDAEAIESAVRSLGLEFRQFPSRSIASYREIDVGIAWTRPDDKRDQCRSNLKLVNFLAHGIPAIVCDYRSYRDVERTLGGASCIIRSDLEGFLNGIAEVVQSETLRRDLSERGYGAFEAYALARIADRYRHCISACRLDWERSGASPN